MQRMVRVPLRFVAYGPEPLGGGDRSGGVLSSIVRSTISGVPGRLDWDDEFIFAFSLSRRALVLSSRSFRRRCCRSTLPGALCGDSSTTISSTSSSSSSESETASTSVPSSSVTKETTVRKRLLRPGGCSSTSLGVDRRRFLKAPGGLLVCECVCICIS